MQILKNTFSDWSRFLLIRFIAGTLLFLSYNGNAQQKTPNGGFGADAASQAATASSAATVASISSVTLTPATVVGGRPLWLRVVLSQAAPVGGVQVSLHSASPAVVMTPSILTIPKGRLGAAVSVSTVAVAAAQSVILTASYSSSTSGASLTVNPPRAVPFTVRLQPASLSVTQGSSGSDQALITAGAGFNSSLTLTATPPAGINVSFTPSVIAAPGSGTSQLSVSVDNTVAAGNYALKVTASDGVVSRAATLTLTVNSGSSSGAVGTLNGCVRTANGHKYQAVRFSMNEAATVDFNGTLYRGSTCDPNQWADQFGFGIPLNLAGFGYTFWFSDFGDQLNTSAIWMVGNQQSQCVDYSVAPDC